MYIASPITTRAADAAVAAAITIHPASVSVWRMLLAHVDWKLPPTPLIADHLGGRLWRGAQEVLAVSGL